MTVAARPSAGSGPLADEMLRKAVHIAFGAGALLLRWLGPWQAAALAGLALLFNLLLLHRLTGGRLLRTAERDRGQSPGIVSYPAVVLVTILVFHRRLELAAAVWGLLAFGDGMAAVVGTFLGRARLPWNPAKTWVGLAAFVTWGGGAAALLLRWTQGAAVAAGWGPVAIGYVGPSFLLTGPEGGGVSPAAMLLVGCFAAALAAALVESAETGVDDNVSVALVGGALLWAMAQVEPMRLAQAMPALEARAAPGALLTAALALGAYALRGVDRTGAGVGWLLGSLLYAFGGWRGYLMLVALFVLGTGATRAGYRRKSALGIAQEREGRRGAGHAMANTVVGVTAAFFAVATPFREMYTLACVAAFATATCDTVSSEIGKAYGGLHIDPLRWQRVGRGTVGAVSAAGTLAGVGGGAVVAGLAAATGLISVTAALAAGIGAFIGSSAESVVGSTIAGRRIGSASLNILNTGLGAGAACLAYRLMS